MEFSNKEFLPLLIAPFLLFAVYSLRRHKARSRWLKALGPRESSLLVRFSPLPSALSFAALFLFILALARPQGAAIEIKGEKKPSLPLLIAIDVSLSMLAEDAPPSRLEAAKRAAARFLDMFHEGPAALAAFAGGAGLIAPFTDDHSLIHLFLKDISSDYIEAGGSDLRPLFSQIELAFQASSPPEALKAVLLISDGESHGGGLLSSPSLKALLRKNVRFFTLSVGEESGAPIPLRGQEGQLKGYKRDRQGRLVETRTQKSFLRELARRSHGAYYHLSGGGNSLTRLTADLSRLKKTPRAIRPAQKKKELYPYPLAFGLSLALWACFLKPRPASPKRLS